MLVRFRTIISREELLYRGKDGQLRIRESDIVFYGDHEGGSAGSSSPNTSARQVTTGEASDWYYEHRDFGNIKESDEWRSMLKAEREEANRS